MNETEKTQCVPAPSNILQSEGDCEVSQAPHRVSLRVLGGVAPHALLTIPDLPKNDVATRQQSAEN
jgi:hypothetical protein